MAAGYSANSLFKKLGYKPGSCAMLVNAPSNYKHLLGEDAATLSIKTKAAKELDVIHFFTNSLSEFQRELPKLKLKIKKDGMIWISWYKLSSKKPTELTENIIRDFALATGLVDVKVCAVDEDWSGLKLVYRLKDR